MKIEFYAILKLYGYMDKKGYISNIPQFTPTFEEISKQMRINQKIIMKEITEHVDKEIERFKKELECLKATQ